MAATNHQHDVALAKLAYGDYLPIVIVDIDLAAPATHDQDLRCADEVSLQRTMHVALNLASSRINDKPYLLLECGRRQEGRLFRIHFRSDDISQRLSVPRNVFNMFGVTSSIFVYVHDFGLLTFCG